MENKRVEPKTIAGFMELLPNEQILFNQMMDTIRKSYESCGFLPIDTPIIEGLTLIDGNDGKMGRISNKQEIINNNILELDERNLEYYCLE